MSSKALDKARETSLAIELRYDILREFLDVPSVLGYLGIRYSKRGSECLGNCPYHNDKHPSWSINWDKSSEKWGVHFCFSCKASGNIVTLTRDLLNLSIYVNALSWLEEFSGIVGSEVDIEQILLDRKLAVKNTKKLDKYNLIKFDFPGVRSDQKAYNYLKYRGTTESQIDRHGIRAGINKYKNSVIFPIRNIHGVTSFYARFFEGPQRELYAAGKDKIKTTLYNYYNCDLLENMCYLVEGCFDALAVERALISMGSKSYRNVFATLGPVLYKEQAKLLKFFDNIVIIPDMDGKAESLVPSCKDLLTQQLYLVELDSGEDPDSTDIKVLVDRIENMIDPRKTFHRLVIDYD